MSSTTGSGGVGTTVPYRERVISYIDGYNIYFGLREKIHTKDDQGHKPNLHWKRYLWVDVVKLSESLLKPGQVLLRTKYFTSRIRGKPKSEHRQSLFLEAISTLPNIQIYFGTFQADQKRCGKCGEMAFHPQEKKTDVNIATQILYDAIHNNFDTAFLITGDSDQVPTIEMTRQIFKKRVVIVFPPKRVSAELQQVANAIYRLSETKLKQSLLPEKVKLPSGKEIVCPEKWMANQSAAGA
jgi:uncharacterized LabA/DUF88 family protein